MDRSLDKKAVADECRGRSVWHIISYAPDSRLECSVVRFKPTFLNIENMKST